VSDAFFTGKIIRSTSDKNDVKFLCRGKGELRNKEIGDRLPDTVHKKYKGKIQPFAWGDWTDEEAYLPLVVRSEFAKVPEIHFDNRPWMDDEFDGIYLYDPTLHISYSTLETAGTQFTLDSDNNKLYFWIDPSLTLAEGIDPGTEVFDISDYTNITYHKSSGSDVPSATILLINDTTFGQEMIQVLREPDSNEIEVERGYGGTDPVSHNIGVAIYQVTSDITAFTIKLNHTFYPTNLSGMQAIESGSIESDRIGVPSNMEELSGAFRYEFIYGAAAYNGDDSITWDIVFPAPGVEGTVLNQYVITKCQTYLDTYVGSGLASHEGYCSIGKDGEYRSINQFTVSGVSTSPTAGAIYQTGSGITLTQWKCESTNLTAGAGTINFYRHAGTGTPSSGSLTKVSGTGDASISFSARAVTAGAITISYLLHTTQTSATSTFNNIDGSDDETDKEMDWLRISDISDLNGTRWHLGFFGHGFNLFGSPATPVEHWNEFFRFGFRIDFEVDPLKYDFYVRAQARKHPGSYFNGNVDELIQEPSIVFEDFCRHDVSDIDASTDLLEAAFDAFHGDRGGWELALSVHSDMEMNI
jgi:hypothetical protein